MMPNLNPRLTILAAALTIPLAILPAPTHAQISDYLCKEISSDWAWFSDHLLARVTYVVKAAEGREYQIGTGMSLWGKPRGRIQTASGITEVTAYGIGAIHVRLSDGKDLGRVCVALGDLGVVTLPEIEF